MPGNAFVLLIAAAWIMYPFVGIINLRASIAKGDRPADAGFSYFPELILFPALFYVFAAITNPWGCWIVSLLCVAMLILGTIDMARSLTTIRRIRRDESTSHR